MTHSSFSGRSRAWLASAALLLCFPQFIAAQTVTTIAGGPIGDGNSATAASLNAPGQVAVDSAGNLYVADGADNRVRKVTPAGVVSTVAGTGMTGTSGDGGPATAAMLNNPMGVAFDANGNLYVSERGGHRLRKISPSGVISTVAGNGSSAILDSPEGLAIAPNGTIYVAQPTKHRVSKIVNGVVHPFAGTGAGNFSGDNGPATLAKLNSPYGVLVEPDGAVLIADTVNGRIRRVDLAGNITTSYLFEYPQDLAYATDGELIVLDANGAQKHSSQGWAYIIGPGPDDGTAGMGFSGDGGPATDANLFYPYSLAVAADGRIFVNDYQNERIRVVGPNGIINTFMGPGATGDGGHSTFATVSLPSGLAYDSAGNLYVVERFLNRVRKISPAGVISTFAGNGVPGFSGDGGQAINASLNQPRGVAVRPDGTVLVADGQNHRVRAISPGGIISTLKDELFFPTHVAADSAGNAFISHNGLVTKVNTAGTTSPVAGGGGSFADNVQATTVRIGRPGQVGFDAAGNVYFTDTTYHTVRKVAPDGIITTVAGTHATAGSSGDGGAATAALLTTPTALVVRANGDFVVSDGGARLRRVSGGTIQTIAGTGTFGFNGDGAALLTQLRGVSAAVADPVGQDIVIADTGNDRVRRFEVALTAPPRLAISDVSVVEGNSGQTQATFTVTLSSPNAGPVTYDISTAGVSANQGGDYLAATEIGATIPAGQTSRNFTVTILGDTSFEFDEFFTVRVSNVDSADISDGIAVGTISNDDSACKKVQIGGKTYTMCKDAPPPVVSCSSSPSLAISDASFIEGSVGSGVASFAVSLSAAACTDVRFDIATANGSAMGGRDYVSKALVGQTIAAGSKSLTFSVAISDDRAAESSETFRVNLSKVRGATLADRQGTGTIVDNDARRPIRFANVANGRGVGAVADVVAAPVTVTRLETGGLYDDIDDGNRAPLLSKSDYALLLADSARTLCGRAGGATIVAVDGVESLAVLRDLGDAAALVCGRSYDAVRGTGADHLGFLVQTAGKAMQITGTAPIGDSARMLTAVGDGQPVTVVLSVSDTLPSDGLVRQLRARLGANPSERLVVLGASEQIARALAGVLVEARPARPQLRARAVERVLLSPAVRDAWIEAVATKSAAIDPAVLHLQP